MPVDRFVYLRHHSFSLEPGFVEFAESAYVFKESVGKAELKVVRRDGADGRVTVHYRTKDIDAKANKDYERKFDPNCQRQSN